MWTWGFGLQTADQLRENLAAAHSPLPHLLPHLDYVLPDVQYDSIPGDACPIQQQINAQLRALQAPRTTAVDPATAAWVMACNSQVMATTTTTTATAASSAAPAPLVPVHLRKPSQRPTSMPSPRTWGNVDIDLTDDEEDGSVAPQPADTEPHSEIPLNVDVTLELAREDAPMSVGSVQAEPAAHDPP
jgi:hypothetical protein